MSPRPAVVCSYERRDGRIVGRCAELDLTTRAWMGRMEAEEEITRAVLARLRMRPDDVVFVHAATVEIATA